jgi:ribosomal protein S27AE
MKTLCPRCGSETLDLGVTSMEVKDGKLKVVCRMCPKCKLIFCEGIK